MQEPVFIGLLEKMQVLNRFRLAKNETGILSRKNYWHDTACFPLFEILAWLTPRSLVLFAWIAELYSTEFRGLPGDLPFRMKVFIIAFMGIRNILGPPNIRGSQWICSLKIRVLQANFCWLGDMEKNYLSLEGYCCWEKDNSRCLR